MRVLDGRAEALARGPSTHGTRETCCGRLVYFEFFAPLGKQVDGCMAQRLVSLGNAFCLNTAELCQAHQILCVLQRGAELCVDDQ